MDVKDMREKLSEVVDTVPRKNEDVIKLYAEKFPYGGIADEKSVDTAPQPLKIVPADNEYTYIGAGETPPHMIKFMGKQVFTRGKLTKVTDPIILAKIKNNPSFIKGGVTEEDLYSNDEAAKNKADKQREDDQALQILSEREARKA